MSSSKRPREYDGREDDSRKQARRVADHYSRRSNQSREERESSPIIHLKKLNNWASFGPIFQVDNIAVLGIVQIKSVLIRLYVQRGDAVLDLACGKGGDLIKYDKAQIGRYVGVDIAAGSVEDARNRYNNGRHLSFPAELYCGDCYEVNLESALQARFDVCSCQFALHYSWSTKERAKRVLENVSKLLNPGGYFIGTMPDSNVIVRNLREAEGLTFGNNVYKITFGEEYRDKRFPSSRIFGMQYHFKLEDAVDCPEWLVLFPHFVSLAESYDLELVLKMNFHEFVHEYLKDPSMVELMRVLGALGDGINGDTLSQDEWDAAYLYLAFVFRKKGQARPKQHGTKKRWTPIKEEDVRKLE